MTDDGIDEVGGHCPRCGAEYRPGFDVCADDETPLMPGPAPLPAPAGPGHPPAPDPVPSGARWVAVASFSREEEARLLAGRLEAEGIETRVFPEFQAPYGEGLVWQPVQVLVPEHRVVEAHLVIERIDADG